MRTAPLYPPYCTDFGSNGLGLMLPIEGRIEEELNGKYELTMVQPITDDHRWAQVANGCILKVRTPVRESPEHEKPSEPSDEVVAVTRALFRVKTRGGRLHLRTGPSTKYKILSKHKPGTEVVQLEDAGGGWYKVMIVEGGATGYMYASYLEYVRDVTDIIDSTKPVTRNGVRVQPARNQLFRIYSVENDSESGEQTAKAMHIFYDLRGNIINREFKPENEGAATAIRDAFNALDHEHPFTLHIGKISGTITGDYSYMSFVEALLDPDEGFLKQCGALLVRDNFDIYIIPDEIRDTGVTIRRRKNLVGLRVTYDDADAITRIIPCGKDEENEPLFLPEMYVDSPHINDYPFIRTKKIDYKVTVGKLDKDEENDGTKFETEDEAFEAMRSLAKADFEAGCDLATYGMDVDFVLLGDTLEGQDVSDLQSVHLIDTVTVIDSLIRVRAKLRSTAYVWDWLEEQYDSMTLGSLTDLKQTTYGFTLPNASVPGNKIVPGSADGAILRDLSVQYSKIDVAAIRQLNAEAINGVTAKLGSITAGDIETNELYAAFAHLIELAAESITAGKIETDRLAAALAQVVSLHAATGDFDFATIRNLLVNALVLQQGTADSMMITNLAVTSANLLSAVIGELVLKGADGGYYRVTVGSDGAVHAVPASVSADEIAAGETFTGQKIVETSVNVQELDAQSIRAASAIIATIVTESLSAGKITAGQAMIASATIPALYTTVIKSIGDNLDLSGNKTVRVLLETDGNVRRWFRFDDDGMSVGKPGSTYTTRTDDIGFHIQQLGETIGSFAKRRLRTEAVQLDEGGMVMRKAHDGGIIFSTSDFE